MTKIFLTLVTVLLVFSSFLYPVSVSALPPSFDKNYVLDTADISGLPARFSSPRLIQSYLEDQDSLLADIKVEVSFEPDDVMIDPGQFGTLPGYLRPSDNLAPYYGQELPVSEIIWLISREDPGNSCSFSDWDVCINNRVEPLNPVFLLAKIQKESGLVRGANARLDPNSAEAVWLIDRAMGYMCREGAKETSCYDENPNWKYFKGFFRQLYYANRLIRINAERCNGAGVPAGGNIHVTGGTYVFDGQTVTYGNHLTCSLYVYTPHISAQDLLYRILVGMEADRDFITPPEDDSVPMRKASDFELIDEFAKKLPQENQKNIHDSYSLNSDLESKLEGVFTDPAIVQINSDYTYENKNISSPVLSLDLDETEKRHIIEYVNDFFASNKTRNKELIEYFLVFK